MRLMRAITISAALNGCKTWHYVRKSTWPTTVIGHVTKIIYIIRPVEPYTFSLYEKYAFLVIKREFT